MERGKAEGKAESLLKVLHLRFAATVSADLERAIRDITDHTQLNPLLDAALDASSLEEFRRTVNL
jgi:hypothetical protein